MASVSSASSAPEGILCPGRPSPGTPDWSLWASRASQSGASAATPGGPRPPAGVLSFKGDEVYLEFIHLTLWKPHCKEQGSVWINRQPHQGGRSEFSFYSHGRKTGDAPRRNLSLLFCGDICKAGLRFLCLPLPSIKKL